MTLPHFMIEEDVWLGKILKQKAFRLKKKPHASVTLGKKPGFYYAKVPTSDIRSVQALQRAGFYVVDTNVTYERLSVSSRSPATRKGLQIRLAQDADYQTAQDIAARCFHTSRFHLDPGIKRELAHRIKREWVRSYARGLRGDALMVAEWKGRIVGFLALISSPKEKVQTVDLIGIAPEYQRQGFAQALLERWMTNSKRFEHLRVGTQVANTVSVRLYEKLGFRLRESAYVLHAHL